MSNLGMIVRIVAIISALAAIARMASCREVISRYENSAAQCECLDRKVVVITPDE